VKPVVWLGDSLERVREEVSKDGANGYRAGAAQVQVACAGQEAAMAEKLKYVRGSGNIFVDLGFAKAEAENLKMRADLMIRIVQFYQKSGMTQAAAAKALGLTQPRLNALLRGKIGQFSLDALVNIASRAGLNVRLVVKKAA
jgi:predicted XRE-type DNA-binding protein